MNIAYKYDVQSGVAGAVDAIVNFAFPSMYLEISVLFNAATFQFRLADGTYGGEIVYDPVSMTFPFIVPFMTEGFMVRSTDPLLPADYQLIAWTNK